MKEILRSTNRIEMDYAATVLRGEGIAAFILDDNMSLLEGGIGAFPRRLTVARENEFRSRAILKDLGILG